MWNVPLAQSGKHRLIGPQGAGDGKLTVWVHPTPATGIRQVIADG